MTKVYKNGDDTCNSKLEFMKKYYANAYSGSFASTNGVMVTCEQFADLIGYQGDPCYEMDINKIYKYTSKYDLYNPIKGQPSFTFWHN
ncbi:protein of unknown function [Agreia sp. COWG]|nr:protein of unknown function [Agreia sp. COWG]